MCTNAVCRVNAIRTNCIDLLPEPNSADKSHLSRRRLPDILFYFNDRTQFIDLLYNCVICNYVHSTESLHLKLVAFD